MNFASHLDQICLQFDLSIQYVQNMQYITLCKCYVGIMVFVYKDIMVFVYKDILLFLYKDIMVFVYKDIMVFLYKDMIVFVYKDILVFVYKDQPISFLAMTSSSRSDVITLPLIFLYRFQTFAKTNQGNPLIII